MGFLTNIWTRYTDRTLSQTKDNILNNLQAQVPEITDHSESNLFVKLISIFSGLLELLHYYIDNTARESHLDSARLYSNVVKLARQWDYRIASQQPSNVLLNISYTSTTTLTFTGAVIPLGAIVQTADGKRFVTTSSLIMPSGSFSTSIGQVSAINLYNVPYFILAVSNGNANQVYPLTDAIAGFSVIVKTGVNLWTSVETFAYSLSTDLHFIQTVNEEKQVILKFGDGIQGAIPTISIDIEVSYDKTDGLAGNVEGQTIIQIVSGFPIIANYTPSVTNLEPAVAGLGIESSTSIKQNVARLFRTHNRAVTEMDFKDIAILHPQVQNAGVLFECGKTVDVYVVPIGGGLAPPSLLNSVEAWFNNNRRIITYRVRAFAAGEIHILATLDIIAKAGFDLNMVRINVENAWLNFFAPSNQSISGAIRIGDIYEAIEATEGVQVSTIKLLLARPYARPLGATTNALNWAVDITAGSTMNNYWKILLISPTDYQLLKNDNFVGTFTIGNQVVQPEFTFTVNTSSYTVGDLWDFVTYPYGQNEILLDETSIPTSDLADITINMIGA